MRRGLLAIVAAALALAPAAASSSLPLTTRLANALAVGGNSSSLSSVVALDLRSGNVVFARHADLALEPASNEKLAITYAALRDLGGTYRFKTDALLAGGTLYLKGFGDPTLTSARLDKLAAQVAAAGVTHAGRLVADESWFDTRRTAPGWKASFLIGECPPLSALIVDRAFYDHHVALNPAVAAAGVFRKLLRKHGVATGPVGVGRAPTSSKPVGEVESAPLTGVLKAMDRDSDNFRAEMVLKELGAQIRGLGTTAAGAAVVRHDLAADGIPLTGVVIADGSGLSQLDRLTATALTSLLQAAWNNPVMKLPFWSALPVAGVNGTLERRMEKAPARGAVRAKTGTTNEASALSGFVRDRYVFAVLQNGAPVLTWSARKAEDRFATALASASEQAQ
ncbi:MAG TPA: D-alanyl-D-alanine carboxypeptidase/D-alanyl-D-alanine-endopeptidase [Gaiellaceae bacterium]|nr:D-alanyl-D-alanine carboxypeptidase/D-alanyl-D-alanine-endopeptidase [Gaiellaceae bacterium]